MKKITKLLLVTLLCSGSLLSIAQQSDTLEIQRNKKGKISYVYFKPNAGRKLSDGDDFLKKTLKVKQHEEFRKKTEVKDELGITHQRYQQYYKGIKIEGAEYLVHGKGDLIETINGNYEEIKIQSVTPTISEQQAIGRALDFVSAEKYKWQDVGMENLIKQNNNNSNASYYPKGELVIAKDAVKNIGDFKLAWKFTISSLIPNNEQLIYVDAASGEVIGQTPLIHDVNTPSTAQTMYNAAPLQITSDSFAGGFRLRESRNGVNIQTLNLHGNLNYANATDFVNNNTDWTAGNWANLAQDQQALDAHWGAEIVLDYWSTVHNRNSIDGSGIRVLSYIHANTNWNNAQWVGGTNSHFMQYGDGDGVLFSPLTALDICAHEFGHGINEFTANLGIGAGLDESDALNEGFSDIWAACIEQWAAPNKQTWLMGEEIFPTFAFPSIRNLENPNDASAAEGPHPDTYLGDFWRTDGEPHNNSTVLSHWFFLLSEGGNGTNDNNMPFNVQGIGINSAAKVAYRTIASYLTSLSNYMDARTGSIMAARILYGVNSEVVYQVAYCWWAVGVGDSPLSYNGDLQGPTQLTPGYNASYYVNPPAGATNYVWSIPSGCYANYCWSLTQGQGTNHIMVKAGKTGSNQDIVCRIYNGSQLMSTKYITVNVQNPYGGGGGGGGSDPCDGGTDPNALIYINSVIYPPDLCDLTLIAENFYFEKIVVYNWYGFMVKEAENVNSFSLYDLPSGIYIIKAQLSNGGLYNKKILKQ